MRSRRSDLFATVHTEGGLLPSDLLQDILAVKKDVPGLAATDYHLALGEKLSEAASRSWSRLLGAWSGFRTAARSLPPTDMGTTLTRERWLLIVFQELGYGRLQAVPAFDVDGKSYPISHCWQHVPIHVLGFRVDLAHRSPGVAGAARSSPHSLVQEFLSRSDKHLWAFVSNGLKLRILRDNVSLTRQAFVEFDLEAMMEGEVYADFLLLWLVCHQSSVEAERPEHCRLEKWAQHAQKAGTRALDRLRDGVRDAIQALGSGFLAFRLNEALRERLRSGRLSTADYYRQVLRTVYRLLFLLVAEDRGLLLLPETSAEARDRYRRFYSVGRLRELAQRRRGTGHCDLWRTQTTVFRVLGSRTGCAGLGLPGLGSLLWSGQFTPDLAGSDIANGDLLDAIRALAFTQHREGRRPVDYRNLGSEELGSVYESLLELHPNLNPERGTFELATAAGHERKLTGSYYTPSSLVNCLLDSALEPILGEAARKPAPERAILELKVCDPACGSGHFLIAAAHRMAKRLAAVRTGDEEPSPEAVRPALRDVVGRCIYGVDINEMAVELAKVALWMEALEPGRPLSFLDHHVRCGNSLIGATPALLDKGIPDVALSALEGDDPALCKALKAQNKRERQGHVDLFDLSGGVAVTRTDLSASVRGIDDLPDDSVEAVEHKAQEFEHLLSSDGYQARRLLADAWCAAFVWHKTTGCPPAITERTLRELRKNPASLSSPVAAEVERLRKQYSFFHWHLAFPDVFLVPPAGAMPDNELCGWNGGFDLVLGNPPWDTLSPDQREFFSQWVGGLRSMAPEEQESVIEKLQEDPLVAARWADHRRQLLASVHFLKNSGVFTLFAPGNLGKGDFNVYRMLVEAALRRLRNGGLVALIVPGGLYGGANASAIRKFLLDECELEHLFGLINTQRGWFELVDIDRFAAFTAKRGGRTGAFTVLFGLARPEDLVNPGVEVEADVIRQLAPDTYAIPDVRSLNQLTTSRKMFAACPAFGDKSLGPPVRHYSREVDMGTDRGLFTADPDGLPVYEGRMIDHFDHRAKTYESGHGNSAVWIEREFGDPAKAIVPQWRVLRENIPRKLGDRCDHYRIGFGDVANPRNVRSLVATLIPPGVICGDKVPTLDFGVSQQWFFLPWIAVANSLPMDWLARARLTSPKMAFSLVDLLPFPRPALSDKFVQKVAPTVLRLVCTTKEMTPFWNQMASHGFVAPAPPDTIPPAALVEPMARMEARAELDAIVAKRVYGLKRQELESILDTFPALKRKDERRHGEFLTKRMVLEGYDRLGEVW